MSKLTDDDIKYVAKLSKFALSNDEIATFKKELEPIISFMDQLKDINTEGVEPTAQVTGLTNVTRKDEIAANPIDPKQLLKNVPKLSDDNEIMISKVL